MLQRSGTASAKKFENVVSVVVISYTDEFVQVHNANFFTSNHIYLDILKVFCIFVKQHW